MNKTPIFLIATAILWTTGCATHQAKMPTSEAGPSRWVQALHPKPAHEPRVAEVPSRPEPIYINPVINEVESALRVSQQ